ncbi:hypothetical protein DAPPUDRAFT_202999 [Daphnia pulex]|uniref:tRNA-5-taurinomethyluridine 2-sulfurtransferase n=1 Tax=Daphnia pulex TaxID=6669 RepID=E9HGG5_DAPPU|nr:hypothetical protein DAPPUDRAFT_202999 [Daphnia pulex]|eukprot:EFX69171.1 hypothetical protein DAPPUDRAFT_202999 [Daphnia pulex]
MIVINRIRRVVCGVSGGVDSSVAALLLKKKGYDVVGVFMKNWDGKDELGVCQSDKDVEVAQRTCKILNIPFFEVNFVKEYWNHVFENLLQDYQAGLTPNPDILCNYHIKFDLFFDYAKEKLDADFVATGHYARSSLGINSVETETENTKLLTSRDDFKDQTFFLSHIKQSSLKKTLFPIGGLLKSEVRKLASDNGLEHVSNRQNSTGICFIGRRNFQEFISEYVPNNPGPFIDVDTDEEVGQHLGIHMWTLGQRCRIGGCLKPYFVASKQPETRTIFVASGTNHPALFSKAFLSSTPHWIHSTPRELQENKTFDCFFRFQHTKPLTAAQIAVHQSGLIVTLDRPTRALTPGQYAVFYSGQECLGCARIVQNLNNDWHNCMTETSISSMYDRFPEGKNPSPSIVPGAKFV